MTQRFSKYYTVIITVIFFILCAVHFFSQRPLWLDEQLIVKNLEQFHAEELFRPLEHSQAFPRIHLIILQAFAAFFDNQIWSLRLFSFVFMIAAFLIWLDIYRREISNNIVFALVLLAFAASYKMSYYAAELKPYAMDVLIIGIFSWFSIRLKEFIETKSVGEMLGWSISLPWLMLFSYTSVFGFWFVTYNLLRLCKENPAVKTYLVANIVSSVMVLAIFYQFDLRHSMGMSGLHNYWQSYFIDTTSFAGFADTFGDGVKKIATYWYGNSKIFIRLAVILIPFVLYGMIVEGIKSIKSAQGRINSIAAIGLILFLELVILGVLQKYPFTGERITLFIAPFIFYYTVQAMASIPVRWLRNIVLGYFCVFCLLCFGNTFWIHTQEYKSVAIKKL